MSHEICLLFSNVQMLWKGSGPLLHARYNAGLMVGRIGVEVIRRSLMGGVSPGLNIRSTS